ncbi:hypothetical protein LguiB_000708 [Lonicera macranthoides]
MAEEVNDLADLYARMDMEEESGVPVSDIQEEGNRGETDMRWCIIGKFNTHKSINFEAMQQMMASVWQPIMGMWAKDLDSNLFLFQFNHEMDLERVVRDGPWTFE